MHLTTECWKDVVGFEGLYQVSNLGKVKTIPSKKRYRPSQSGDRSFQIHFGYCVINLFKDNKSHYKRVHRLVAEAFIPNPNKKPCVNHINGIKTDNRIENLEWCTHSENEIHSYNILGKNLKGIKKSFKNGVNVKCKKVLCVEKNIIFNSIKDAANGLNLQRANITAQIKGKINHTGGFTFKIF